jgi:hypothetical protein
MAYNTVVLNPGVGGNSVAVDRISSADYQRIKLGHGAEGVATDASSSSPLPVVDKGNNTTYHLVAAATTNAQSVKASPGVVRGITVFNNTTYPVFLKFHNTAGTPTAGASVYRTIGAQAGVMTIYQPPGGINFSAGIGITIVKGIADNDTTAVAANDCVVDLERE